MKAKIDREDGEYLKIYVTDNNATEHDITIEMATGKIAYHGQDGYPDDPSERSMIDEVEPINQARRYAKYHVNRERGYDTIDWRQDPDRILGAALTLAELDADAVAEYFGDLYDQVRSHFGAGDRPVALPDDAAPGHVNYQQDIYLGLDEQALRALVELGEQLGPEGLPDAGNSPEQIATELLEAAESEETLPAFSDLTIEAVSGVHVRWDDATGRYHHERTQHPDLDRHPDARIDVLPFKPDSLREFRAQLVHNLCCQVRDCYVEMGVTPPEPFRITGLGKHKSATWYEHYDYYQRYHDPDADIDWEIEPEDHTE